MEAMDEHHHQNTKNQRIAEIENVQEPIRHPATEDGG
jgi:hypothetical protein